VPERLALPGFVNVHSHTFQRALRGRAAGTDFWAWRDIMLAEAERQTPELVREAYEHG
jgi:formimidoylglutamate deiminase